MKHHIKELFVRFAILAILLLSVFELRQSLVSTFSMISPLPIKGSSKEIFEKKVLPRLTVYKNNFHLMQNFSFIPRVEAQDLSIDAPSYLLADLDTGEVLFEKNGNKKLPIASLTKIMSSIVALDLAKKDDIYVVSDNASKITPTRIGVIPREEMKMQELLEAMLMTSANDAAEVLKEGIDGYYQAPVFVEAMNKKAQLLGLKNTHFENPQGFDSSSNFSSSEDLAVLIQYALKNYPFFSETVQKDYGYLPQNNLHKQFDLPNWNGLIDVYPDVIGIKIGNTDAAGMTTAVVSKRGGKRLLAVVLGARDIFARDLQAATLLDEGYMKTLGLEKVNVSREQLQQKYNSWYQK